MSVLGRLFAAATVTAATGSEETRERGKSVSATTFNEQTSHALFFTICDRRGVDHSPLYRWLLCAWGAHVAPPSGAAVADDDDEDDEKEGRGDDDAATDRARVMRWCGTIFVGEYAFCSHRQARAGRRANASAKKARSH